MGIAVGSACQVRLSAMFLRGGEGEGERGEDPERNDDEEEECQELQYGSPCGTGSS